MKKIMITAALVALLCVAAFAGNVKPLYEVDGNTTVGALVVTNAAMQVTNGQAITVTKGVYVLEGTGQTDNFTNTVTLANAGTPGLEVTLIVKSDSSNLITIADSGIMALSGAWVGDNDDVLRLYSVGTNWVETGEVNN